MNWKNPKGSIFLTLSHKQPVIKTVRYFLTAFSPSWFSSYRSRFVILHHILAAFKNQVPENFL